MEMLLFLTSPIPIFPNVRNFKCKHLLILGLQIFFPFPPDQCDMEAEKGITISSVFVRLDYICMSAVDANAVPSFFMDTTLPPLVQSTKFSEIFQPFRSFQFLVWAM